MAHARERLEPEMRAVDPTSRIVFEEISEFPGLETPASREVVSFNAGAESGDSVSANTSCWFALRRRTSGPPIAPLAPAIRILIALSSHFPVQLALRRLASFSMFCPFLSRSRVSMETP
jgi:hypothetical protein